MADQPEFYGLAFTARLAAAELEPGAIVVLDGHVLEATPDPENPERVRLVIVPALGPPPGRNPDQREIVINAPRDMMLGTARPQNIELAPLPDRP
jgi:hypothetical protein